MSGPSSALLSSLRSPSPLKTKNRTGSRCFRRCLSHSNSCPDQGTPGGAKYREAVPHFKMAKISPQESDCDLMVERVEQLELIGRKRSEMLGTWVSLRAL